MFQWIELEKLGCFKKNGSEKGFRMKKLWPFEKKIVEVAGKVRESAGMKNPPKKWRLEPKTSTLLDRKSVV